MTDDNFPPVDELAAVAAHLGDLAVIPAEAAGFEEVS